MRESSSIEQESGIAGAIAAGIVAASRALRAGFPVPRGCPFYGLDHDMPYPVDCLRVLSSQGIFRKYEFVLELESGFGGRARWAANHFGCRVLGIDPDRESVAVALRLGVQSKTMAEAVFCAGQLNALPFREGAFTHAWWLWPRSPDPGSCLVEVHRVLRDGGYFAWVIPGEGSGRRQAERLAGEAGFLVTAIERLDSAPFPAWVPLARRNMVRALASSPSALVAWRSRTHERPDPTARALLFGRRGTKQVWT